MKHLALHVRIALICGLWWTVALSPAPIVNRWDKLKTVPEQTQGSLSAQQSGSGMPPTMGFTPQGNEDGSMTSSSLVPGTSLVDKTKAGEAAESETYTESGGAHEPAQGPPGWIFAVLGIGVVFGTVIALRVWSERK